MKKVFIVSTILLVFVLIFLGIYNIVFKKSTVTEKATKTEAVQESTAEKAEALPLVQKSSQLEAVSDEAVLGATIDVKNDSLMYYSGTDGTVWSMDLDGKNKRQLTITKLPGLVDVNWSPDLSKVLTTFKKDGQLTFYMYDQKAQKGVQLKKGLDSAAWDNTGTKIFYKYFDAATKKRTLNVANYDGSGWQKIADITARDLQIKAIPKSALVSFWNSPDLTQETQLQIVSAVGGESKTINKGKFGVDYLWSPDGTMALVSSLNENKKVMLGTITQEGTYRDLNVPTLASKCAWSADSKTIYFALPGGIPENAMMPNDYRDNKFFTDDTFWKMDLETGKKERLIEASEIGGRFDLTKPFLAPTEDAMFFTNKIDQKLYKLTF